MKPTKYQELFLFKEDAPFTAKSPPPLTLATSSSKTINSSAVLGILVFCTALLSAAFFCFYARCSLRRNSSSSPAPAPACKKVDPSSVVGSLPVTSYGGDLAHRISKDCAVCLGEFGEGDYVKVMPFCSHVFHPECIDTWLFSHVSCPVCRSTLVSTISQHVA